MHIIRQPSRVIVLIAVFALAVCLPLVAQAVANTWSPVAGPSIARTSHTTTLLPSGKLLAVGGIGGFGTGYLASTELYDPASKTWSSAADLAIARAYHAATLLPSGRVLVTGGFNGNNGISAYLASTPLYDPTSNTWSVVGDLSSKRAYHTATLLRSGKVLVVGGINTATLATSEIYDPASQTWSSAGNLVSARYSHTATLLPSGKVLVAAGYDNNGNAIGSAEVYDPARAMHGAPPPISPARAEITLRRCCLRVRFLSPRDTAAPPI